MLLLGAGALGYSRWSRGIAEADSALAAGQYEAAIASYAAMEARFDQIPSTREIFAKDYEHIVANHLFALYHIGRFDETIEQAQRSPDQASPHFWAGCAFFEKAKAEEETDSALALMTRAEEELKQAVQAAPNDWDTKYDYELATRLASALRK